MGILETYLVRGICWFVLLSFSFFFLNPSYVLLSPSCFQVIFRGGGHGIYDLVGRKICCPGVGRSLHAKKNIFYIEKMKGNAEKEDVWASHTSV